MPFFSIIIPTYNRSSFLKRTVQTICKQRYSNFELIIVDDGSTDNTSEIVKQLQDTDPRIKYIHQVNSERGAARNKGFLSAQGEYVVFFDSDDFMHEDHLSVLYHGIHKYNNPNFIATKYYFFRKGEVIQSDTENIKEGLYDYKLFLNGNPIACNVCVKRNNPGLFLFEEDRKYSVKEDWMFLLQNLKSDSLVILDSKTLTMFDHDERSMRIDHLSIIQKTLLTFEWIEKNVKLANKDMKEVISHAYYFCSIHAYIAHEGLMALNYLMRAAFSKGFSVKYLMLFTKIIISRKLLIKFNFAEK